MEKTEKDTGMFFPQEVSFSFPKKKIRSIIVVAPSCDIMVNGSTKDVIVRTAGGATHSLTEGRLYLELREDSLLSVPGGLTLEISGVSGDILVSRVEGVFSFETVSGDVVLKNVKGSVETTTVSGDFFAESSAFSSLSAISSAGEMVLRSCSGEINLRTISGEIEISGSDFSKVDVETSEGGIYACIGRTVSEWELRTNSGDILISVDARPDVEFECHTKFGVIIVDGIDYDSLEVEGNFSKTFGSGATRVVANTQYGDVNVLTAAARASRRQKNSSE